MNAPARPTFQSIPLGAKKKDIDQLASAATTYAVKDNIPVQVHPRPVQPAGQGAPAASEPVVKLARAEKRFERFTVEIPTYLYDDILKRIGSKKQTKKSIVLNAFKDAGFYVAAEDLIEDGRRGK
jgi:hypothetical protein